MSAAGRRYELRMRSLSVANRRRVEVAEVRRRLRADPRLLREVLLDPPRCLDGMPVIDVIVLARSGRRTSARLMHWIGGRALADRVNVLVPIERASRRTREWAARHALMMVRRTSEETTR